MFSSFDAFKATLDSPDTHWAIDVYTPPDAEYRKIHDWASQLHTRGYQLGKMSDLARKIFRDELIDANDTTSDLSVFFTPTGTAANAMARAAVLDQNKSVILCSEMSHQSDREAGSVESLTGSRALKPLDIFSVVELGDRKFIDIDKLAAALDRREDKYLNQRPWMISLSMPAEDGSIPSLEYVKQVGDFAKANNMLFHMDGARMFVAAAALGKTIKQITVDMGVDIFSLGGSKVGMIGVDAVVFTPGFYSKYPLLHHYKNSKEAYDQFRSVLKRIGGLSGRSEESSAQFARAMTDGYGISVGARAWKSAVALGEKLRGINGVSLQAKVETNVVLVKVSTDGYNSIIKKRYPYMKVLDRAADGVVIRFQASHCTTEAHITEATDILREVGTTCPL